uniref:Uncharacterized protein n=1 Tax=Phytophthora ramorum TaxID=164328 RepID=H3GJH9_PHYRM
MEGKLARVELRIGEFGKTSRTIVPVEDAEFEFDEEHDSFEKIYSLAEAKVSLALNSYSTKTTRADMKLYMKPSQHAQQAQLVAVTAETWHDVLGQAKRNYKKQKTFDGPFIMYLLMYGAKEVRQGIRRATLARISESAEAIDSYVVECQIYR